MQKIDEIEEFYRTPDPWGYRSNLDDILRRKYITEIARMMCPREEKRYSAALDLACGEGWITAGLPAFVRYGYECSELAAARFPDTVRRFMPIDFQHSMFDLVLLTGALYPHYDSKGLVKLIKEYSSSVIILCNIQEWEDHSALSLIPGKQVFTATFPYRQYVQQLRVFKR